MWLEGVVATEKAPTLKKSFLGEFNDQSNAKWIVIKWFLRGHNDMPRRSPQGVLGVLSYN
jgi:hypothetical protein